MPQYAIITENDESKWDDVTGRQYHFPKRYLKFLNPGTRLIYYKGRMRNKEYEGKRLTKEMHYFGTAIMGKIFPDTESSKDDCFGEIENFFAFAEPVLAKTTDGYLEKIPESRKKNYWRDGVREIDEAAYMLIVEGADLRGMPGQDEEFNDLNFNFGSEGTEGGKKNVYSSVYERNPKLRRIAIAYHGTTCVACGFNFEKNYGEYGKGYIHIHHINPLHEQGGKHFVDPIRDLAPLCANCHAIVHRRRNDVLSIEALRRTINSNRSEKS